MACSEVDASRRPSFGFSTVFGSGVAPARAGTRRDGMGRGYASLSYHRRRRAIVLAGGQGGCSGGRGQGRAASDVDASPRSLLRRSLSARPAVFPGEFGRRRWQESRASSRRMAEVADLRPTLLAARCVAVGHGLTHGLCRRRRTYRERPIHRRMWEEKTSVNVLCGGGQIR